MFSAHPDTTLNIMSPYWPLSNKKGRVLPVVKAYSAREKNNKICVHGVCVMK